MTQNLGQDQPPRPCGSQARRKFPIRPNEKGDRSRPRLAEVKEPTPLQAALNQPLKPGSRVLVVSSGAAENGSPMSGGYGGAKRMLWFMA
jgi:hypothetical protein